MSIWVFAIIGGALLAFGVIVYDICRFLDWLRAWYQRG